MKNIIYCLSILLLFAGCSKANRTFEITVKKNNTQAATITIDDKEQTFTDSTFTSEVVVSRVEESALIYAIYADGSSGQLTLTVRKKGVIIGSAAGCNFVSAIVYKEGVKMDHGTCYTNSGGGGGTSSGTCYCGAPTKDGTPCKRKVVCGTGYCWQHS